jgi:hypothetical protein
MFDEARSILRPSSGVSPYLNDRETAAVMLSRSCRLFAQSYLRLRFCARGGSARSTLIWTGKGEMRGGTRNKLSPDPAVVEMRRSLAERIAALAGKAGEHSTAIPGLFLYYRTMPTPCYRASYEPSLSIFAQGGNGSFSEVPSIYAMDLRFCCHRSTCLR